MCRKLGLVGKEDDLVLARKQGQIIARGERRWLVRVYLGRDRQTRRRRYHNRTIRGPLGAAQRYLNARLREREQGRDLVSSELTLNEYLDRWLEMAARPKLRAKSYSDYESLLRLYIRPALGERMLRGVSPMEIQGVYQRMHERGLSSRAVRYTHAVLHAALEQAIKWRLLLQNAATGVELPKASRREMRVMTPEEARQFLRAAMKTKFGVLFALALTTGMRPSEYLALRCSDIDWQQGTATVSRTLEKRSGWTFAETKRARSRRLVKLQSWVIRLLHRTYAFVSVAGTPNQTAAQLFSTNSGEPVNSDYLARQFKGILHRAGIPSMRLYDLRHTAATLALAAGVPAKVVSEQLGHATSAFTLDVYSHVLPHMQSEAAKKVETLLAVSKHDLKTIPKCRRRPPQSFHFGNTKTEQERAIRSKAG